MRGLCVTRIFDCPLLFFLLCFFSFILAMSFWRIVDIYCFILYVIFGALLSFIPLCFMLFLAQFCYLFLYFVYIFFAALIDRMWHRLCVDGQQPYSLTGTYTYTHLARKCTRGSLKTISRILPTTHWGIRHSKTSILKD